MTNAIQVRYHFERLYLPQSQLELGPTLNPIPPKQPEPQSPPALVMSVSECSQTLCIGRTAVFRLLKHKEIESFRCGRRRLILRQSVLDYISRQLAREHSGFP